jgi:hypothetical protein
MQKVIETKRDFRMSPFFNSFDTKKITNTLPQSTHLDSSEMINICSSILGISDEKTTRFNDIYNVCSAVMSTNPITIYDTEFLKDWVIVNVLDALKFDTDEDMQIFACALVNKFCPDRIVEDHPLIAQIDGKIFYTSTIKTSSDIITPKRLIVMCSNDTYNKIESSSVQQTINMLNQYKFLQNFMIENENDVENNLKESNVVKLDCNLKHDDLGVSDEIVVYAYCYGKVSVVEMFVNDGTLDNKISSNIKTLDGKQDEHDEIKSLLEGEPITVDVVLNTINPNDYDCYNVVDL